MSRLKRFFKSFFLVDILRGLAVTLRLYFSRKVTIEYPEKVKEPAPRFRGLPRLYRDETGEPLCIACKLCQKACGTNCFDIEGRREEGAKFMRPVKFDWKLDRCSFCGFCVEVCPTNAIRFSHEFRLTGVLRDGLLFHRDEMYLTGDELQEYLCGGCRRAE
ncbi:MAG TPA: NADH-quinone oxidoreductase subunit I [Acidobacteriota bacterium]|nr:NADH-quinone oxidoreductase subunit I [Acidobacteriota bacterium]